MTSSRRFDPYETRSGVIKRFHFEPDHDPTTPARPGLTVYVIVSLDDAGRPLHIDCPANTMGSMERGLLRGLFELVNSHLDRGLSLTELVPLFRGTKFEPTCMLRLGAEAHAATSPLDAIFRWIEERFGSAEAHP